MEGSSRTKNPCDLRHPRFAAHSADWVYFRYLPPNGQIEAVHQARKRAFIAGPTVAGELPENWQQAADVGIDAILTDHPLSLAAAMRGVVAREQ